MADFIESFGRKIRTIKHNDLFLVDDVYGNIPAVNQNGFGLYLGDTRMLSCFEISLNGTTPAPLLSSTETGYLSSLVYTNGPLVTTNERGSEVQIAPETVQLRRETIVFDHLYDRFLIENFGRQAVHLELQIVIDADFFDMFEIRGIVARAVDERMPKIARPDCKSVTYQMTDRSQRLLETRIIVDGDDVCIRDDGTKHVLHMRWLAEPREPKRLELRVAPSISAEGVSLQSDDDSSRRDTTRTNINESEGFDEVLLRQSHRTRQWQDRTTRFSSDNEDFNEMMRRNARDIQMLLTQTDEGRYVAAGIPWFVALFGRDSLITSLFCLPFNPEIARETLLLLARYQADETDASRDAQPGKILHELRTGSLARLNAIPHTPYYGSVDSTPLWLILLKQYCDWTGDLDTIRRLWPNAIRALQWMERNILASQNGYCIYGDHPPLGIVQQGWKDSNESVMYSDGRQVEPPVALCEVQSYVYQARESVLQLGRLLDDPQLPAELAERNEELKTRFNRDFWLSDEGYCALALDGDLHPCAVISSNAGHCLESGLLTTDHAHLVAERLMEKDLFNGWGIRTLSCHAEAYNPMSYHNGSVWPHDNAMIARGLSKFGYAEEVEQIFSGLFHASRHMAYRRLPELFCGFDRSQIRDGDPPVRYPVACIPQAWAAASAFSLLQSMLNMSASAIDNRLTIREARLPSGINNLRVDNLRVGKAVVDLEFRRTHRSVTVDVSDLRGDLAVQIELGRR